jgi:hypothetical protein
MISSTHTSLKPTGIVNEMHCEHPHLAHLLHSYHRSHIIVLDMSCVTLAVSLYVYVSPSNLNEMHYLLLSFTTCLLPLF